MKKTSIEIGPTPVTMGVWMALARAIDAWARLQNARAAKIEQMNKAGEIR